MQVHFQSSTSHLSGTWSWMGFSQGKAIVGPNINRFYLSEIVTEWIKQKTMELTAESVSCEDDKR